VDPAQYGIPLEVAHRILGTFGITKPTKAYNRWVKEDGFDLKDFAAVLFDSPFIFILDWRGELGDLEAVTGALEKLGVRLVLDLNDDGDSGWVSVGSGHRAPVAYSANVDDVSDWESVCLAIQSVVPATIEFRSSPDNDDGDTCVFAVLPQDEWADLERIAPEAVHHFFQKLRMGPG
jgi:hypothetical protein